MDKRIEKEVLAYLEDGRRIPSIEYRNYALRAEWYDVCFSLIVRGYLMVPPEVYSLSSASRIIVPPYYTLTPAGTEYAARTLRPLRYWFSQNWFPTTVVALNIVTLIVTRVW